ncbi:hypothetical protein [Leptospira alexanderi]|uniref:hypothetical protein n=1 Tax=Leptospira alexanderi TaxID=100053 RepID=UPI0009910985|nr:hypothetical protein [Leptospira alexanderi]
MNLEKAQALLALISSQAKEEAIKAGLEVVFRRGDNLICRKPGGEEIVLKKLPPRVSNLPAEFKLS